MVGGRRTNQFRAATASCGPTGAGHDRDPAWSRSAQSVQTPPGTPKSHHVEVSGVTATPPVHRERKVSQRLRPVTGILHPTNQPQTPIISSPQTPTITDSHPYLHQHTTLSSSAPYLRLCPSAASYLLSGPSPCSRPVCTYLFALVTAPAPCLTAHSSAAPTSPLPITRDHPAQFTQRGGGPHSGDASALPDGRSTNRLWR